MKLVQHGYPFRFYGRSPQSFSEGGVAGHLFSVHFTRLPSDAELTRIARDFEQRLSTGCARPTTAPWLWSGRFAAFTIGERWISSGAHISAVLNNTVRAWSWCR